MMSRVIHFRPAKVVTQSSSKGRGSSNLNRGEDSKSMFYTNYAMVEKVQGEKEGGARAGPEFFPNHAARDNITL